GGWRSDKSKPFEPGRLHNASGMRFFDDDQGKIRLVLALEVQRSGDARCAGGADVGVRFLSQATRAVLLGVQAPYCNPCLIIAGACPQRQEANVAQGRKGLAVQIVELDKGGRLRKRANHQAVLASKQSGQERGERVADLCRRLTRAEAALFALDVKER